MLARTFLLSFFLLSIFFSTVSCQAAFSIPIQENIYKFAPANYKPGDPDSPFCSLANTTGSPPDAKIDTYLCLDFPLNTVIEFNASSSSEIRLWAVDSTWTKTQVYYGADYLPEWMNGLLPMGQNFAAKKNTFLFKTPGVFYFRDRMHPGTVFGALRFSNTSSGPGSLEDSDSSDSSSSYEGWEVGYGRFLSWLTIICLWISIAGCLFTLLTFTVHSDIRTYPIKLIMYLCVAILMADFSFLMGIYIEDFVKNDPLCFLTAMSIHGFFLADFCWMFCIAFNFYQMIVNRNREAERLEKWYHLGSWGVPVFCMEWVLGFLKYGDRGGLGCYINDSIFIFVFFFLPGLIIISANVILFFFVAREIRDTLASAPRTEKREMTKECRVYISIFVSIGLSWIFGFIMALFTVDVIVFIFNTLFTIFTGLQGALIFVFYCINMKVLGRWAGLLGKCIPLFRRWENLDTRKSTSGRSQTSRSTSRMASAEASSASADTSDSSAAPDD